MSDEETEARDRLLFHLENQTGFWFALVVGDDVQPRARLRKAAEDWCKDHGRPFFLHEPEPQNLAALAVELAREPRQGLHWIRADGPQVLTEQWEAVAAQLLLAMNERREAYRKRLDGGVVIEGREPLKRLLREMAPDLFSVRAFIAEMGTDIKTYEQTAPEWRLPASIMNSIRSLPDPEHEIRRADWLKGIVGIQAKEEWFDASVATAIHLHMLRRRDDARQLVSALVPNLKQRLRENPEDAQLRFSLGALRMIEGEAEYLKGKDRGALRCMDAALAAVSAVREHIDEATVSEMFSTIQYCRGDIFVRLKNPDRAAEAYGEPLKAINRALEKDPLDMPLRARALTVYLKMVGVWMMKGEADEAEAALHEALAIAKQGALERPGEEYWQFELALIWRKLGQVLTMKNDHAAALKSLRVAMAIAEKYVALDAANKDWRKELDIGQVAVGLTLFWMGDSSEAALRAQERAIAAGAQLLELNQEYFSESIRGSLVDLALSLVRRLTRANRVEDARANIETASILIEKLPSTDERKGTLRQTIASLRRDKSLRRKKK